MLSLNDIITASGRYPERINDLDLTPEVKANIEKLLAKVNPFLAEIGVCDPIVSSGFRPASVNAAIPRAAIKSQHLIGCAVDIADKDGKIDELVSRNDCLLKKYGLWVEDPISTKGWCHLDMKDRGKRPKNKFIP